MSDWIFHHSTSNRVLWYLQPQPERGENSPLSPCISPPWIFYERGKKQEEEEDEDEEEEDDEEEEEEAETVDKRSWEMSLRCVAKGDRPAMKPPYNGKKYNPKKNLNKIFKNQKIIKSKNQKKNRKIKRNPSW